MSMSLPNFQRSPEVLVAVPEQPRPLARYRPELDHSTYQDPSLYDYHGKVKTRYGFEIDPELVSQWLAGGVDPTFDRLRARSEIGYQTCWRWVGPVTNGGHGRMRYQGKVQTVHRIAYQAFIGEIPEGMTVHRVCYDPQCWYPGHLELVTYHEAMRRRNLE